MELLEIYDDFGNKTGKVIQRGDKTVKLEPNEHIAISVIYIENSKGEFLIQKTSKEKGSKYSSTGGHVSNGENPLESIVREVKEELGVDVQMDEIKELGYVLYDMPLRYIFYLKKDIPLEIISVQKEEVEKVEYMSVDKIKTLIEKEEFIHSHSVIFDKILEYRKI